MHPSACVAFALILLAHTPNSTHASDEGLNNTSTCTHYFEKGVEAYLEERYDDCVKYFENAIRKYREYTYRLQNCRLKCHEEAELSDPLYPVDIDNLLFYERAIKSTLCIVRCKQQFKDTFGSFNINRETEKLFQEQKHYEYLHICYLQNNKEPQKAASAAFTYLVTHPNDTVILANLKHYSSLEGVDITEVVNYEAKDYVYLYVHGADAYDKKNWEAVIQNMEESLAGYLQAEQECRAQCEGPFDQGWYPDFIPSIANHFTYCLKCKQKCRNKLNSLNGEIHEDLLPSHYHYLQYAYFKMGDLKSACAAVASYLLFYPKDETMLMNMKYYSELPKGNVDFFVPRPEAVHYMQRQTYEQKILKFVSSEFKNDASVDKITAKEIKYRVVMTEKQLGGPNRFLSEGLATPRECKILMDIVRMFAILGDGYEGEKSPHTVMEKFEGVTLSRAAFLVYFGLMNPKHLELLLKLTENAKKRLEEYFQLKQKLFFTYTHLVCRSALPDSPLNRTDFSHPVHADNCNLLSPIKCEKEPPAYTWRDYSAIIYLNSNFEGGEFVFSADIKGRQIQSTIEPECGRMVGFSSGPENLHGVRAVKKDSRCAIGLWFTFDPNHLETERDLAYKLLNHLKSTS